MQRPKAEAVAQLSRGLPLQSRPVPYTECRSEESTFRPARPRSEGSSSRPDRPNGVPAGEKEGEAGGGVSG